ncbi:hypothetical protein AXG93_509s1480 [Marchantia polymorpha subsp. ruderalis]|uniref:Tetratricopeptide repeat protein 37 n=1 Tax=Marchantia polymorpha subsp. ruderalis TaxID=1480154 RepID=A0A176WBT5_MARPO|nr:hypothetical protein AXG93_509s1480 [Marchantia polymorpha subsp. ruderalis]
MKLAVGREGSMGDEKVPISAALRVAQDALVKGQYQEVVKQCKVILKQDRNNYDGYVLLGSALLQLKQHGQAEKAFRLAIGVNNSKMAAWQRLVEIYESTANINELVEACEAIRERTQVLGKMERYVEYTQKLANAHLAQSNFKKACVIWQELIDSSSTPESVRFEAVCGISDAKSALLERSIQEEYKKRLSQSERASSSLRSSQEHPSTYCMNSSCDEDLLLFVEEEYIDRELSKEVEELLRRTTSEVGPHLERHHEMLLRLLVRRMRAARHSAEGDIRRTAKLQTLRQCMSMISSCINMTAFEVACKLLEDDDSKDLFEELGYAQQISKHNVEPPLVWLGRCFAHTYPGHGIALSALGFAMHYNSSNGSSLERKRIICEKALRLDDNCVTGWQVLANVHVQQSSYSSAAECVRRGLHAVCRSRMNYGLSLVIVEAKFQLTLGQTHLATQDLSEAERAFRHVAEEVKETTAKEGCLLVAAANEVLILIAFRQLFGFGYGLFCREAFVLFSHWALAEQGWLAYQQENWKKALLYLEQAVALQPSMASYHYRLGLLYWKAGGLMSELKDKVLSQLLEAVKLDPTQSEFFRQLGHCYNRLAGDTQRAIRCYQKAVNLNLEDEEAGEALCDLLDCGGQEVLEVDICRGASQKSRRAFWAWRRLGLLQVFHKEWSEAVPNLQHALRGYVTDGDLWEALGLAYQHLGMLTAALKAYGRATSLGDIPSLFALLQTGNILLLLGSYEKATDAFREALQQDSGHVGALCGLAAAILGCARKCMSIGAFAWSASLGKDALELLRLSIPCCSNIGAFWKLLGDLEVTYAQALPCEELDSMSVSTQEASVRMTIQSAIDLWYKKRIASLKRARVFYQRALHLSPSQSSLYSDLGLALDLISSLEHENSSSNSSWMPAVTAICGGLRVDGDNPDLWVTLGMLTKHKGLRQHSFIQALRINGNHALAWGGLGQLYLREGQEALAREAFDRARSANPTLPLPWAGMAYFHSLAETTKDLQEAYASCMYAVQLSPTTEVQLGLGKLAAHAQQLQAVEVYAALQQAVHHAPHRAEAHNLKGLACESRGDYEGAFVAAIQEYEVLGELGLLRDDSGALRGYSVALWQVGNKEKAVVMARKSMEVEMDAASIIGGQALLVKMIYSNSGCSPALAEMQTAPVEMFSDTKFCLSALAIAALSGNEKTLYSLINSCKDSLGHEGLIQAHLLAAASKQISGERNLIAAIQVLQKTLHLFPQSVYLRARLGELILESSLGKKADLVPRCCQISYTFVQRNANYGDLCSALAAAACACAHCGQLESCNFSPCKGQVSPASSLIRQLQRWAHKEPWNVEAHYLLVLNLMQQAKAQNFPANLCQAIRRLAATTVSSLPTKNGDRSFDRRLHVVLLVIISECTMRLADNTSDNQLEEIVSQLRYFSSVSEIAALQLARVCAFKQDYRCLEELSNARRLLSADDIPGWFTVIELQQRCKFQELNSSIVACREAILRRCLDEQKEWFGLLDLVRVKGLVQAGDFMSAQRVAAEALSQATDNSVLHLLHGTLCAILVSSGTNVEMLSSAVRSLTKAMNYSKPSALPFACTMLCQSQNAKECRPAELYFQMGLLARKAQVTFLGPAGATEPSWTVRGWIQRAVHLKPDSVAYWSHLEPQ